MDVVFAKVDGVAQTPDGAHVPVRFGSHWPADDPVVKAHPDMFSPDSRYGMTWYGEPPAEMADPPVEQATAAPGERRGAVRRG